jgi:hypothetical protein
LRGAHKDCIFNDEDVLYMKAGGLPATCLNSLVAQERRVFETLPNVFLNQTADKQGKIPLVRSAHPIIDFGEWDLLPWKMLK